MNDKRNLGLQPRKENNREKKPIKVTNFDLGNIYSHFNENLVAIKRHFALADDLVAAGKENDAKDIWRTQIVFLESALDYYIHEITKYGMNKIFNKEWSRTEKYNNYNLKLSDVLYVISNPEETSWFLEHVNNAIISGTFMDYKSIKDQLNLLGIDIQKVADKAFYVQGSNVKTIDQLKRHLNRLFKRRNEIAHQSDRNHYDGTQNNITREDVMNEIQYIEKIVKAIYDCASDDSCRVQSDASDDENIEFIF